VSSLTYDDLPCTYDQGIYDGEGTFDDLPVNYDSVSYSYDGTPITSEVVDDVEIPQAPGSGAGGGWDDVGTGYVWKDHGWVKATKVARVGVSMQFAGRPSSVASATLSTRKISLRTHQGRAATAASAQSNVSLTVSTSPPASAISHSFLSSVRQTSIVSRYNGVCETLSLDELVALMGMAA